MPGSQYEYEEDALDRPSPLDKRYLLLPTTAFVCTQEEGAGARIASTASGGAVVGEKTS